MYQVRVAYISDLPLNYIFPRYWFYIKIVSPISTGSSQYLVLRLLYDPVKQIFNVLQTALIVFRIEWQSKGFMNRKKLNFRRSSPVKITAALYVSYVWCCSDSWQMLTSLRLQDCLSGRATDHRQGCFSCLHAVEREDAKISIWTRMILSGCEFSLGCHVVM